MNNKFFLLIFAVFLIGNVCALTQTGEYEGSFDVDVGDAGIVIGKNVTCAEDWTCSYWSECAGNIKTFMCRDCADCGTYYLLPQNCGATESCQQNNNGGSSSGGGSSGGGSSGGTVYSSSKCTEKWNCSEWSACQAGNQIRICQDKNNCKTTSLKPSEERVCEETLGTNRTETGTNKLAGLTGAIIGALGTKGIMGITIFIILIVVAAVLVNTFNQNKN